MGWLVSGLILLGLVVTYLWPLKVHASVKAGSGVEAKVEVTGLLGRAGLELKPDTAGYRLVVELRPVHLWSIRWSGAPAAVAGEAWRQLQSPRLAPGSLAGRSSDAAGRNLGRPGAHAGGRAGPDPGLLQVLARVSRAGRAGRSALRAARRWLAGRLQVEELELGGRFGTGDAAVTARLYGGAWVAVAAGLGWAQEHAVFTDPPRVRLVPAFGLRTMALGLTLRVRLAQGHALAALAAAVWMYRRSMRTR